MEYDIDKILSVLYKLKIIFNLRISTKDFRPNVNAIGISTYNYTTKAKRSITINTETMIIPLTCSLRTETLPFSYKNLFIALIEISDE